MGLGVNSLDNVNLLAFQVADSDRLVEKSLESPSPSTVIGSSSISDVFVPSESTPLQLFSKSLREVMVLKETGKITDPEILKEIEGIKQREQTYKELLAKGESVDEVVALIQNDTKYINETLDKVKIAQNQQNIIYQRYTGGEMSEIADPNATWRKILAVSPEAIETRPEDIEKGLLENFQAENRKLIALSQSNEIQNQEKALRMLNNQEVALKMLKNQEVAPESSDRLGRSNQIMVKEVSSEATLIQTDKAKLKTRIEDALRKDIEEFQKLIKIPESDLTDQQKDRKKALEGSIQERKEMMKKEGWIDDLLRNMSEADRKRLEQKAKDGTLGDEESDQILNRGLADSDKSGRIMRGFYTADDEEFRKLMGRDKQSFYNEYNDRYQLDAVLKKEMALSLRRGTYSDANYYRSIDSQTASGGEEGKKSNLSLAERVANIISELQSRGELSSAEQNLNNKDIAQKLGLKPDHPIVLAIAAGDYDLAQKLSVGLTVATSVNATAPDNQGLEEWLSFSSREENNLEKKFLGLSFV